MPHEIKCRMVGLHSLFLDDTIGTSQERHVIFCDLDRSEHRKDPLKDPKAFKEHLHKVMEKYGVGTAYVFQTLKGVHVVSPCLVSRQRAERFEEALEEWGSDGFHRFMGYKNGGTVIRVTEKPGEQGIKHIWTVNNDQGVLPNSGPHWRFLESLYALEPPVGFFLNGSGEVRLEAYDTVARFDDA